MDAVWAEEFLRNRGSELTPEGLRHLTLLATGDEKAAEDAWLKRVEADMRRGKLP